MSDSLVELRHRLHRAAERSGGESNTAAIVREQIEATEIGRAHV